MTTKTTIVRGVVATVEHAGTSRNGNPTYRVTLDDGRAWLTGTDSGVGYAATNFRPRRHLDRPYVTELTIGGRGRIVAMRLADATTTTKA